MKQDESISGAINGKEPSAAVVLPHMRLAAAVVAAALRDFASTDPVLRLDAALWLMNDGQIFLEALGITCMEPAGILCRLANNKSRRQKLRRFGDVRK